MTDPSTHGSSAAKNSREKEPLTQIEGIGKTKQQWFESIGISTLQALAGATLGDLEAQLSADGHTASSKDIEKWIMQAQDLIAELVPLDSEESEKTAVKDEINSTESFVEEDKPVDEPEASDISAVVTITTEDDKETDIETVVIPVQEIEGWQAFAEFTVEFQSQQNEEGVRYQTVARHLATKQEKMWSGIEEDELQLWLRSQVADIIPSEFFSKEDAAQDAHAWITPTIEDLFILQPPSTTTAMGLYKPNMMFPSPIIENLPFSLALQFSIQGQNGLSQAKQAIVCRIECYARNLKGGESISLGELPATTLLPQQEPYTTYLPAISLQKGIYRLHVFLSLKGVQTLPAFIEVPVLQVV